MKSFTRGISCAVALSLFMTSSIPSSLQASTYEEYKVDKGHSMYLVQQSRKELH